MSFDEVGILCRPASAVLVASILIAARIAAAESLGLGDVRYKHELYHHHYQNLFNQGRCSCDTGECRPTIFRLSQEDATAIEVLVNREWYTVPESAIQYREDVPPQLWTEPAHVCAYPLYITSEAAVRMKIECVVINSGL